MEIRSFPFTLDVRDLGKKVTNRVRAGLAVSGIAALLMGVLITFWPGDSWTVLTLLLGIYWVIAGVSYFFVGILTKGIDGWSRFLDILMGVLFVIGGIAVMVNPIASELTLAIFVGVMLGVLWIFEGILAIVQSGDVPSHGWAIFFGIVSILAGICVLFAPMWSTEALFWIAGIGLIVLGIVQIVRAIRFGHNTDVEEVVI